MLKIKSPVFIIGCYRGGTSLLFRLLSESNELWSLYRESNHMWRKYHRHPLEQADTVLLDENEVKPGDREYFDNHYHFSAYNNYVLGYLSRVRLFRDRLTPLFNLMNVFVYLYKLFFKREYRIIDKTPPNCYRVSFLAKLYPDAKFIYITRNGEDNVSSLMNTWRSREKFKFKFRKYLTQQKNSHSLNIKGYKGDVWKFFIPADWEQYVNSSLEEVCAHQWLDAHEHALQSFTKMGGCTPLVPSGHNGMKQNELKCIRVKFEDLETNPEEVIKEICSFIDIDYDKKMQKIIEAMPLVNTVSKPSPEKKSRNRQELENISNLILPIQIKLGYCQQVFLKEQDSQSLRS